MHIIISPIEAVAIKIIILMLFVIIVILRK